MLFLIPLFFIQSAPAPLVRDARVVSVIPEHPIQGEPILVALLGGQPERVSIASTSLPTFLFHGTPHALYGFDLRQKPGSYTILVRFPDGGIATQTITLYPRREEKVPLSIPQKLGGNTPQSQQHLVSTLAQENAALLGLRTSSKSFWTEAFGWPLSSITITDPYGYLRQTGAYTIAHRGTDFRAAKGEPVLAMNRGVVRMTREFRNYGKTVVIDHGLGVQTLYLHLSRIRVNVGELVAKGQLIGNSGDTGYAEHPHLHVSVRIRGISIDPVVFLSLFKK